MNINHVKVSPVFQALWSLCAPAGFQSPTPNRSGIDLAHVPEARTRGDVYLPIRAASGHPSVVVVHGGAFLFGHRAMKPVRFLIGHLLEQGIAVCSVDYRYLTRGGRLTTSVTDVTAALRGWVQTASECGCTPSRVSMVGISAGATVGLLAAASAEAPPLEKVVSFYGMYDLSALSGPLSSCLPRCLIDASDTAAWGNQSPIEAGQPPCPTLLIHGSGDGIVSVSQAEAMAAKRHALRLPTEQLILPDAPHSFLNQPCKARDVAVGSTARFLLGAPCLAA